MQRAFVLHKQHNSTLCSVDLADCMLGTERGSAVLGLASVAFLILGAGSAC